MTEKSFFAQHSMKIVPPKIRNELLNDESFCKEVGIMTTGTITLGSGNTKLKFEVESILKSVRKAYEECNKSILKDQSNTEWCISRDSCKDEILLESGVTKILLPGFMLLSNNLTTRLGALEH
jgi:hypothetical protein